MMTTPEAPILLALRSVRLGYPGTEVLDGLDWTVRRGERWAIVGPNGAGKTTLLKTVLGLIPLLGGSLSYFATDGEATARPSIGYLPQINQIDRSFPIRVEEVIASGLYGSDIPRAEEAKRVDELLDLIGLSAMRRSPLGALSGGQLQRVLLARALASHPELVILDEPTSFLDRAYKAEFDSLLERLISPSATIIMVTHDAHHDALSSWQTLPLGRW